MPEFLLGLVADAAQADNRGKLSVLGEFSYIFTPTLPAQHGSMAVVGRWEAEKAELAQEFILAVEILGPDGEVVLPKGDVGPLKWAAHGPAEPNKSRANAIFQIAGLVVRKEGGHVVRFYINGAPKGEARFYIAILPKVG
jgi:hypothetical protein